MSNSWLAWVTRTMPVCRVGRLEIPPHRSARPANARPGRFYLIFTGIGGNPGQSADAQVAHSTGLVVVDHGRGAGQAGNVFGGETVFACPVDDEALVPIQGLEVGICGDCAVGARESSPAAELNRHVAGVVAGAELFDPVEMPEVCAANQVSHAVDEIARAVGKDHVALAGVVGAEIGRASCRERVCQYV